MVADMTQSFAGLSGAVIFLALGVIEYAVFMRAAYPLISERHEAAKVTLSQGLSPATVSVLMRLQCFIFMPLIGYVLGGPIVHSMMGT
jgi:hypothetical protein